MKLPNSAIRLETGEIYDFSVHNPKTNVLKVAFGGYTLEQPFECTVYCRLLWSDASILAGPMSALAFPDAIGESPSLLPGGSIRLTENKTGPDEWQECFVLKLDQIPPELEEIEVIALSLTGKIDQIYEHFVRISDHTNGKEIFRADVPECLPHQYLTYGVLKRSDSGGWYFQFLAK